jgi:iron complex transport system permease protein
MGVEVGVGVQLQHPQLLAGVAAVACYGADGAQPQAVVAAQQHRQIALAEFAVDRVMHGAVPGHHFVQVTVAVYRGQPGVGEGDCVVGVLLQTVTRNDLADPFLFGLSSGASAGAVAVITLTGELLGIWTLPLAALAGGLVSAATVLAIVKKSESSGPEKLILAGLATSFLFGAITHYQLFAGDQRAAHSVLFWTLGGLGLARWDNLGLALFGLLALLAFATGAYESLGIRKVSTKCSTDPSHNCLVSNVRHDSPEISEVCDEQ